MNMHSPDRDSNRAVKGSPRTDSQSTSNSQDQKSPSNQEAQSESSERSRELSQQGRGEHSFDVRRSDSFGTPPLALQRYASSPQDTLVQRTLGSVPREGLHRDTVRRTVSATDEAMGIRTGRQEEEHSDKMKRDLEEMEAEAEESTKKKRRYSNDRGMGKYRRRDRDRPEERKGNGNGRISDDEKGESSKA